MREKLLLRSVSVRLQASSHCIYVIYMYEYIRTTGDTLPMLGKRKSISSNCKFVFQVIRPEYCRFYTCKSNSASYFFFSSTIVIGLLSFISFYTESENQKYAISLLQFSHDFFFSKNNKQVWACFIDTHRDLIFLISIEIF